MHCDGEIGCNFLPPRDHAYMVKQNEVLGLRIVLFRQ
jgi:hypothetical protein